MKTTAANTIASIAQSLGHGGARHLRVNIRDGLTSRAAAEADNAAWPATGAHNAEGK